MNLFSPPRGLALVATAWQFTDPSLRRADSWFPAITQNANAGTSCNDCNERERFAAKSPPPKIRKCDIACVLLVFSAVALPVQKECFRRAGGYHQCGPPQTAMFLRFDFAWQSKNLS